MAFFIEVFLGYNVSMNKKEFSTDFGGKKLTAEFNDWAENADGSVLLKYGETVILATAMISKEAEQKAGFFPLTVDYEEKFYAVGKILGSRYARREGRPADEAILSARIVDRTIRPLFDQWIRNEIQVIVTVLALGADDPQALSVIAASLALGISKIPFHGPVSAAREANLIACGKDGNINMIEVGANEAQEEAIIAALSRASEEIEKINAWQKEIVKEIGKEKMLLPKPEMPDLSEEERLLEETGRSMREQILKNDTRPDGRKLDELRPLAAFAGGISPILHGAGLFYRGGTHILSVLTLGFPRDAQTLEGIENDGKEKRFMHQYNFPPYSVGETGRADGTNRRMIGHGALAEKALLPMIPKIEDFPYTIRVVSEALSSNGSTSMGSICASTLALLDGGVPMKKPVAGISCGLISDEKGNYKILTDIAGSEDHFGDMDFKVAGTRDGITAVQMDVKVSGVSISILREAFEKAKQARMKILDVIRSAIEKPREHVSERAPKIKLVRIRPDMIGEVIGPGGKNIKHVEEKTGATIDIHDDGTVYIMGKGDSAEKAALILESLHRNA